MVHNQKVEDSSISGPLSLLLHSEEKRALRLPLLDAILSNFYEKIVPLLRSRIASNLCVRQDNGYFIKFHEYMETLGDSVFGIFDFNGELTGQALIALPFGLSFLFIEMLLGRRSSKQYVTRTKRGMFTNIDRMMLNLLMEEALVEMQAALSLSVKCELSLRKIETNMRHMNIDLSEEVYLFRMGVSLDDVNGNIDLILPYSLLRQGKSYFSHPIGVNSKGLSSNPYWGQYFRNIIKNIELLLCVEISDASSKISSLVGLNVGDTIVIGNAGHEDVEVKLNGEHFSHGKLGKLGDSLAVQLTSNFK